MHIRFATVCLLVLGGLLGGPMLTVDISSAAPAPSHGVAAVAQQQPNPTSLPVTQPGAPRFSTIPPLPPTPTSVLTLPTRVPVPTPTPVPAAPAPVVPAVPAIRPAAPPPIPAATSAAPRAGGFPTEVALLLLTGSVTALGGSLYMLRRKRTR